MQRGIWPRNLRLSHVGATQKNVNGVTSPSTGAHGAFAFSTFEWYTHRCRCRRGRSAAGGSHWHTLPTPGYGSPNRVLPHCTSSSPRRILRQRDHFGGEPYRTRPPGGQSHMPFSEAQVLGGGGLPSGVSAAQVELACGCKHA